MTPSSAPPSVAAHPPSRLVLASSSLLLFALVTLGGCASLPPGVHYPKAASVALEHPEETPLGRHFADASAAHPGLSALRLVPIGIDGFLLRRDDRPREENPRPAILYLPFG